MLFILWCALGLFALGACIADRLHAIDQRKHAPFSTTSTSSRARR